VTFAVVAAPLIASGVGIHAAYHDEGVAACLADRASRSGCEQIIGGFFDRYVGWADQLTWFTLLPALAGLFVGAPLLGREFEHGTWKLAFTQTITRTRWLIVKLTVVGLGVATVAFAFTALFTWWRQPLDAIEGHMFPNGFNLEGPTPIAAALFAFATGTLAGVLIRRTVAAMAATLITFVAVRAPLETYARPRYQTPRLRITEPGNRTLTPGRQYTQDWPLSQGWIDAAGRKLNDAERTTILRQLYDTGTPIEQYMAQHGLRHYTEYHPASSFWTFQAIEAGIYLALAAALLTAAIWLIRRRTT
jgi:hypothetical protein